MLFVSFTNQGFYEGFWSLSLKSRPPTSLFCQILQQSRAVYVRFVIALALVPWSLCEAGKQTDFRGLENLQFLIFVWGRKKTDFPGLGNLQFLIFVCEAGTNTYFPGLVNLQFLILVWDRKQTDFSRLGESAVPDLCVRQEKDRISRLGASAVPDLCVRQEKTYRCSRLGASAVPDLCVRQETDRCSRLGESAVLDLCVRQEKDRFSRLGDSAVPDLCVRQEQDRFSRLGESAVLDLCVRQEKDRFSRLIWLRILMWKAAELFNHFVRADSKSRFEAKAVFDFHSPVLWFGSTSQQTTKPKKHKNNKNNVFGGKSRRVFFHKTLINFQPRRRREIILRAGKRVHGQFGRRLIGESCDSF